MNNKLLLVKSITLLYRESQFESVTTNSAELIKQIANGVQIPEDSIDIGMGRETIVSLRGTALWMSEQPVDTRYDHNSLMQRIRVNVGSDDGLYEAFVAGIEASPDPERNKSACIAIRHELKTYLNQIAVKEIINKASHSLRFQENAVDWKVFTKELCGRLEPYMSLGGDVRNPASVDSINLSELNEVTRVLRMAQEEISASGILKTQWQAINRMMGDYGGMRRGDFVCVGALQHNFKTGFTLGLAKGFALYNQAIPDDPLKKPMIIHLSFENNLTDNIMQLYISLKENETGQPCDVRAVTPEEAAAYVADRLQATGYNFHMARYDPSDFTYHDLFDLVLSLEAQGYEIHAIVCDYLNMMSKKGCSGGANGADIRDLFRRVRNFTSPRRILFVTPHQLSPDAKYLLRQGVDNFVKEVANKGYWDSCKAIDQEIDLELIIHKEVVNGVSYLCVQRGKHRKVSITPEEHLYTVLMFQPIAGIPDDINGTDLSRKHVGGKAMSDGGEAAWWA